MDVKTTVQDSNSEPHAAGQASTVFEQRKRSIRHTYTLYDGYFNVAYADKSGSSDVDLQYGDIPRKSSIQIDQNEWLRNVGYLWIALGIAAIVYAMYSGTAPLSRGFWIFVGIGCVGWAHFSKVKYTVFRAEHGNVFLIQDKDHDRILDELNRRKKLQLLQWYGDVNPENTLDSEIRKFRWLAEQEVISQEESEQKIAQAELLHRESDGLPSERLN